ncbi:MAG: hypothetical protein WCA54_23245, partial [Pseudolabrys sp.]
LILGVLLGHVVSAEATEVLLKARDQATENWAKEVSKSFHATAKKLISGLNAVILRVPSANVANLVKSARDNPAISAVEAGGDYRQLFKITPTTNFDAVQISPAQREAASRLRGRKTSASVYVTQVRPAGISLELLRGALTIADGFSREKSIKLNLAPGMSQGPRPVQHGGGSAARRGGSMSEIESLVPRCCKVVATMNPAKTMRFVSD